MKTKEAIEVFLDNVVRTLLLDEVGAFNYSGRDNVNKKVDEVIGLLKRGEKFEKMWIGLCERAYRVDGGFPDIHNIIEVLEIKYFPETYTFPKGGN